MSNEEAINIHNRCKDCEFAHDIRANGNWWFKGCMHKPYRGKWIVEIKECPKERRPMSDLIRREDAIKILEEHLDYLFTLNTKDNPTAEGKWYGVNWARNTIAELPSAEPTIDTVAERIDITTWYSIHNGKLVEGASGREEALYKAEDIFRILEEMGASDI